MIIKSRVYDVNRSAGQPDIDVCLYNDLKNKPDDQRNESLPSTWYIKRERHFSALWLRLLTITSFSLMTSLQFF